MNKLVYKNITRFSLPVVVKTVDGARTTTFMVPPLRTFAISAVQGTGDIQVKVKNRLLQLVSEEANQGSTTEFPSNDKAKTVAPKPVQKEVKEAKEVVAPKTAIKAPESVVSHTSVFPTSNKDVTFTSREIDKS